MTFGPDAAKQSAMSLEPPGTLSPPREGSHQINKSSASALPVNLNPTKMKNVPKIVEDENSYRLMDLIHADFKLPCNDRDFDLTHEQLIKCCKILLYKFNLYVKKGYYERDEMTKMINDRVDVIEQKTKSSLEEINTFLHQVHQDFEGFLNKHKKEHTNLNMRVLKVSEDMASLVTQFTNTKTAVEQYATVLTCLAEFNSIEQALATQDEEDRD